MRSMWTGAVSAGTMGLPRPSRGEERFFGPGDRERARVWAMAGGVAIYGRVGWLAGIRVIGQLPVLFDWAARRGLEKVLPAPRGMPPEFVLIGELANQVVGQWMASDTIATSPLQEVWSNERSTRDA